MKKSLFKSFVAASTVLALAFAGCSVDSSDSSENKEINAPDSGKENKGDPVVTDDDREDVPVESVETKTNKVEASIAWIFSDLKDVAIEGVDASTALADSSALSSASVVYKKFSDTSKNKYSLKSDVSYPSKDKSLTAQIKSLGKENKPIQYNKYDSAVKSCSQSDATAGALQFLDEAFVVKEVQGPFKIKINYGANSKDAKTDGRYAYIKFNDTEIKDEKVIAANSLDGKGVGFTAEYSGTDKVDITVGATNFVFLYDVIITKEVVQTTTVKTTTYPDGSSEIVTTVTDESGKVVSEDTKKIEAKKDDNADTKTDDKPANNDDPTAKPSEQDPTATAEYTNGTKIGRRSKINEIDTSKIVDAIHVSTAEELETAITKVKAGSAIVIAEGTYSFDHQLTIALGNNGTASAMKYIMPEKGAKVTLDFSSQFYGEPSTNPRGIQMNANYWHIYGLTVYGAADNGIFVAGKHNIVERCVLQANRDTGLQISRRASSVSDFADWPSDNLILNCTAFDNHDPATDENADGFASKLTCGNGNVFDGCIAYCNSDDGWDLYAKSATGSIGVVTIKNCVAFGNGKLTEGSAFANGDMNGFKLGGSNGAVPTSHIVYNCMSFGNGHDGFTDNGNGGALRVTACSSYGNAKGNFNFYRTNGGKFYKLITSKGKDSERFAADSNPSTIEKTLFFNSGKYYYVDEATSVTKSNCKVGTTVSDPASEFKSSVAPVADKNVDANCRNADGTVNMNGYLETKDSSSYKDLGAHFGSEAYEILDVTLKTN